MTSAPRDGTERDPVVARARTGVESSSPRRWATPTGDPCPRSRRLDGGVDGSGDCCACGVCLLFGGLVD